MQIDLTEEELTLIIWLLDATPTKGREVMKRCVTLGDKVETALRSTPKSSRRKKQNSE